MQQAIKVNLIAISDLFALWTAFYLSFLFKSGDASRLFTRPGLLNFVLISSLTLLGFYLNGLYQLKAFSHKRIHFKKVLMTVAFVTVTFLTIQFFSRPFFFVNSRLIMLLLVTLQILMFLGVRVFFLPYFLSLIYDVGLFRHHHLLVVTDGDGKATGAGAKNFIEKKGFLGYNPLSIAAADFFDMGFEDVVRFIRENDVKEIFYESKASSFGELQREVEYLLLWIKRITVKSELLTRLPSTFVGIWDRLEGSPVFEFYKKKQGLFEQVVMRFFDLIISFFALIMLLPFFLIIGLLIKLTSKGPVFFSQPRVGHKGELFKFFKFRSMEGDEKIDVRREDYKKFINGGYEKSINGVATQKVINERRITSVGKTLRKLSLDEFPQLINVLKGEMTLVGPRPYVEYEVDEFEDWHRARFRIKPGLTGLWQVYGRSSVSFNTAIFMDYCYVINKSIRLDMFLILKTFPILLFGTGAY